MGAILHIRSITRRVRCSARGADQADPEAHTDVEREYALGEGEDGRHSATFGSQWSVSRSERRRQPNDVSAQPTGAQSGRCGSELILKHTARSTVGSDVISS